VLTPGEILFFHDNGYLGPYPAFSPEEMISIRCGIEQNVLTKDGPNSRNRTQGRHQDCRIVYDLCAHPAIVNRVRSLMGDDLVLWASSFWIKEPGDPEVPWHQDITYWPINPAVNVSAWIAIDPVTTENACVQLIAGSHKEFVPHIAPPNSAWKGMADPAFVESRERVKMELKPGEFFLFTERLLHHSEPNRSNMRRMGLAARLTVPFVKVDHDRPPLYPGHAVQIVSGTDRFGFNRVEAPPAR
jgi:ectoine hydroxylase-related dioxygenase (phytanoyl-CoA dioxygenase family)